VLAQHEAELVAVPEGQNDVCKLLQHSLPRFSELLARNGDPHDACLCASVHQRQRALVVRLGEAVRF
jgi:hypothetical protein